MSTIGKLLFVSCVGATLASCGGESGPCGGVELTMTSTTEFMIRNNSDEAKLVTTAIIDMVEGTEKKRQTLRVNANDFVESGVTQMPAGMKVEIVECQ